MAIKVKSNKKQRWRIPRGPGAHSILHSVKVATGPQQPASSLSRCSKDCLGEWQKRFLHLFQYLISLPENLGYFQVLTRHRGPQAFWQQEPVLWKMIFPQTGFEGQFGHDSSALHLLCTLFLLLLPQLHLRSSGIRSQRLGTLL